MKNKNAIKNNMGQEVLKVVKVLHLSQSGTVSDMDSESRLKSKLPKHTHPPGTTETQQTNSSLKYI